MERAEAIRALADAYHAGVNLPPLALAALGTYFAFPVRAYSAELAFGSRSGGRLALVLSYWLLEEGDRHTQLALDLDANEIELFL